MLNKFALTFFSVLKMPIQDIIDCSKAAERAGFGYISVAESFYRDGFALASSIASHTTRIKLGTSVMPIFTRSPFQLAMGAATLQESSHGRVGFLGLGVGYRSRTEEYFGIKQANRVERMREYVEIVRTLLSGENGTYHGKFFYFQNFPKLSSKPLKIPIYFGSSAPKMLELAGQVADGVILNSISTPEYVKFALEKIEKGARDAGRAPSEIKVGHSIVFAVADNTEEAANAAKEDILFYISYPELDPILERSPFREDAIRMRELYKTDKTKALSMITDEMLDMFAVYGTPRECRAKLKDFLNRGIELPIIRVSVAHYKERERKQIFLRAISALRK